MLFGLEIPSNIQDIAVTIVTGSLLVFLLFFLVLIGQVLIIFKDWAKRRLATIDATLVPFGQSATGRYLHGVAESVIEYVDEPDDSLIIKAADLLHKTLPQTNDLITREQMSEAATTVVAGIAQLLDGVKQVPPEVSTPPQG